MLWVRLQHRARCTTLCDKVCQWLATGQSFFPGSTVSTTNKTDRHNITEILLKVALNTIKQTNKQNMTEIRSWKVWRRYWQALSTRNKMNVDYKVISGRGIGSFHHHISRQIKTSMSVTSVIDVQFHNSCKVKFKFMVFNTTFNNITVILLR